MVETDARSVSTDSIKSDTIVKKEGLGKRLNKKLSNNYYKSKYDTNYVVRPKEKWLLRAMVNQTGNYIHAKGTVNDIWSKYDLHTKKNTTIGLEVNYCDLAVSLSLNPAKMRGDYDDYEFNFEYHGNRISFDVNYQRATSLTGDVKLGDMDHLDEEGLRMNIVNVAAYYSFNHRRFSFPAALYQNYYQRRSAGSWLAGASFQGGSIKTTDAPAIISYSAVTPSGCSTSQPCPTLWFTSTTSLRPVLLLNACKARTITKSVTTVCVST